ncbi:mpv17-like protein isoform X1 [Rhea pennata]|uniref:mpv17-like protein isoform X1 n=1 Tax=Rhea pennata TaxID=8795 RepID=UPI002E252630
MAAAALRGGVRRFPWLCNVLLYAGLFAAGDAAQQLWRRRRRRPGGGGPPPDWAQTRRVALVALAFHGNFSYVWLRALERALPGRRPAAVLAKVLCDQLLSAPVAVLAFYTGMSILQKKEDIFSDCRKKFWNTYKTGLMYWPFVQLFVTAGALLLHGLDREKDHASSAQSTPGKINLVSITQRSRVVAHIALTAADDKRVNFVCGGGAASTACFAGRWVEEVASLSRMTSHCS